MTIDYDTILYGPIYSAFGVSASITSIEGIVTDGLTVIDKTEGVMIEEGNGISFATSKPAAVVRMSELTANDLTRAILKNATITFNGGEWKIVATQPKPNPAGAGELYLILEDA